MRKVFFCESKIDDMPADIRIDRIDDTGRMQQGKIVILFDQQQRDEMIAALQLLTFPGEDLEDDNEED